MRRQRRLELDKSGRAYMTQRASAKFEVDVKQR
jgi:hypothetical protein